MADQQEGCVTPAGGPIHDATPAETMAATSAGRDTVLAQVGKVAPDFEAGAYVDGGFQNVRLSDFRGRWVTLCFYPGDFTFV